jgi:hypothetical protein
MGAAKHQQRESWKDLMLELASFPRPSASAGERRAAELIAAHLRERGCEVAIEQERAHGGYWWPLGLANLLGLLGLRLARRGSALRRVAAALAAGTGAAVVWDEAGQARRWFRRALLPHRPTWNVLAEAGDRSASRTIVFVAHHDAAHSGLVFHPALGRIGPRLFPRLHARATHTLPIIYAVWLGPALICAGALLGRGRLGRALSHVGAIFAGGSALAMADIGVRRSVPGANDNLSAVGVVAGLAQAVADEPAPGLGVLLLSTGSEESFSEGMHAFLARHRAQLPSSSTEFICLECLGGPTLIVLEGEGMLRMRTYDTPLRDELEQSAAAAGVTITRGFQTVVATDALAALNDGYRAATLASLDHTKLPLNYHWPNDSPEHLHWSTIEDALAVCVEMVRRCAATGPATTGEPQAAPLAR